MSSSTAIEMYQSHPFYRSLINELRQGGSIPVDFIRMDQPPFEASDPAHDNICLGLELQPGYSEFSVDFGDGKKVLKATPNDIAYLNPTRTDVAYAVNDEAAMLFVAAPIDAVAAALCIEPNQVARALEPLYYRLLSDDGLRARCLSMWQAAATEGRFASLAVDHGFLALVTSLMAEAEPNGLIERLNRNTCGVIDGSRMVRVVDYIEANLEAPLKLAELAALSGLSDFHFSRTFKRSSGHSPHQFVILRRLERVKRLLVQTEQSVTEIAHACGFASSQHLATVFRRRVGVSPTAYRRERRR